MKIIVLTFDYFGGEETIFLPYEDNIQEELFCTYKELKAKWEKEEWGYNAKATVKLSTLKKEGIVLKDPKDTQKCSEFWGLWCFTELMINPEFYSRPFDNTPNGNLYSSQFAVDCDYGRIYSKDFAYFHCEECGRDICQQNPSNGWMVQYRFLDEDDGEMICLKCYEVMIFENGCDEEKIREGQFPGMFLDNDEIEEHGYEIAKGMSGLMVASGYSGYSDPKITIDKIIPLLEKNKVIIQYDSMAIGGMGGYITVWIKPKTEKELTNA